ncbi:MAG TPA: flagellar protein FlhE [Herbaspirillum sp.]|jgi:flagellar protein FlhE
MRTSCAIPAAARALALAAAGASILLAPPSADADARVDRSFGMAPSQGTPSPSPQSLFSGTRAPVHTAAKPSLPPEADPDQHGSYSVEVVSPIMYSKNMVYVTPFPLPPHVNARVTINGVRWKYGTATHPSGFEAALCWKDSKTCINVSRYASGQSMDFNGRDAMQPFLLQFQVAGSGTLSPPVVGETAQIIVGYRVWPQ